MNDVLVNVGSAVVGLLGALTAYVKIASDRKKTAETRDSNDARIEARVATLETRVNGLDELRAEVKEMNKTLSELVGMFKVWRDGH